MSFIVFDSRKSEHKTPFGAVKTDESIVMNIGIENGASVSEVRIMLRRDDAACSQPPQKIVLSRSGSFCSLTDCYSGSFSLPEPGLYFYRFEVDTPSGVVFCGRKDGSVAAAEDWLPEWQLTVYDKSFKTPKWAPSAVMYQIFPDRFNIKDQNFPATRADRYIHASVGERPLGVCDMPEYDATDFYGGNFAGIEEKLPYLKKLGVTVIYLNPIFEASSNHRYNTGDYMKTDPYLGTNDDFARLCDSAKSFDIRVVLDGVFSHTGDDSVYFNRFGHYDSFAAYNCFEASPYRNWYLFGATRDDYECWWGFKTLPNVNESDPSFMEFVCGADGVLERWMHMGVAGWRLDVADELPDDFIEKLRISIKNFSEDALILGEVWEDASNKISYGSRRRFILGNQLDGVMNYPFRKAILSYVKTGNAQIFADSIMSICENYPLPALLSSMNLLSSHDTARAITELISGCGDGMTESEKAEWMPDADAYAGGRQMFMAACALSFTLPGMASVYYGDENGMCGFRDPWCRRFYNWESNDIELRGLIAELSGLRRDYPQVYAAQIENMSARRGLVSFERCAGVHTLFASVNSGCEIETVQYFGGSTSVHRNARIDEAAGTAALGKNGFVICIK